MAGGLGGSGGGGGGVTTKEEGEWRARATNRNPTGGQVLGSPGKRTPRNWQETNPDAGRRGGGGRGRGGGGGRGGGRGGGGGGGGGGGRPNQAPANFDIQQFNQNIEPNEFQTNAYGKMEDLYGEVPDYFTRAMAQSRAAGSQGLENELGQMGSRGFGPGSGFTGRALADYGRGVNQDIMGGQIDAAQKTFADKMGIASGMGQLGSGIAGNMAQLHGQNIGAYNALANYALGNERNQINWYDAQARSQQNQMANMTDMMRMTMQSGMRFL